MAKQQPVRLRASAAEIRHVAAALDQLNCQASNILTPEEIKLTADLSFVYSADTGVYLLEFTE